MMTENTIHMAEAIKKIENLAASLTMSPFDGYSKILRICKAINNNEKNLEAFGNINQRDEIRFIDQMAVYSGYRKILKRRAKNILNLYAEKEAGFSFYYEAGKWKPVYLENIYDLEKYHIGLRFYEIHSEDTRDSYPFEDVTVVPLEDLPEGTTLEYAAEISWHEDDGTFMGRVDIPLSVFVEDSWKQYLSELLDKEVETRKENEKEYEGFLLNEKSEENPATHLLGLWAAKEQCENELYSRASYIVDMFEDKNVAVHFCCVNNDYELKFYKKFYKKPAFCIFECKNWRGWYSLSCRIVRVEDETENPFPYAVQIDLINPEDRSTYGTYTISLEMFADPNWKQKIEDLLTEGESILKLSKEELERKEKEEEESKEYEEYLRLAQKYGAGK